MLEQRQASHPGVVSDAGMKTNQQQAEGLVLDTTDSTSIGSSAAGSVEETAATLAAAATTTGSLNPPIRDSLHLYSIQAVEKENDNKNSNRSSNNNVAESSSSPNSNNASASKNSPPVPVPAPSRFAHKAAGTASKVVRFSDDAKGIWIDPIPEFLYQDVFWSETELATCWQHASTQVQSILQQKTPCPHIQTMEHFYDTTSKEEDPEWKRTNHLEAWSRSEYRGLELWCSAKMQQEQKLIQKCILNYANFLKNKQDNKQNKEELLRIRCENLTKPSRDFATYKGKSDIQHSIQKQNQNSINNSCSNSTNNNTNSHVAAAVAPTAPTTAKDQLSWMKRMESDSTDTTEASSLHTSLSLTESRNIPKQQQVNKKKSMIRKCLGRLKLHNTNKK